MDISMIETYTLDCNDDQAVERYVENVVANNLSKTGLNARVVTADISAERPEVLVIIVMGTMDNQDFSLTMNLDDESLDESWISFDSGDIEHPHIGSNLTLRNWGVVNKLAQQIRALWGSIRRAETIQVEIDYA